MKEKVSVVNRRSDWICSAVQVVSVVKRGSV